MSRELSCERHRLHFVTGAAGVGKSTFGKRLAARHAAVLLDSDTVTEPVVRAGLMAAGMSADDRDSPRYKELFRDAVYKSLFQTAIDNLMHIDVVIIGPFSRELGDPDWPERLEHQFGVMPTIWYLHCKNELRRQRMIRRGNPRDQLKLANWRQHVENAPMVEPTFDAQWIDTGRDS